MLIIEIELLIALVLVLIAITRRTAITQWLANRRYQTGLKRARRRRAELLFVRFENTDMFLGTT